MPSIKKVDTFLDKAGTLQTRTVEINKHNKMVILEDKSRVIFESYTEKTREPIHRNYIQIDENERNVQEEMPQQRTRSRR